MASSLTRFGLVLMLSIAFARTSRAQFCLGEACPCGNDAAAGSNEGCKNSLGVGGLLQTAGSASVSGDSFKLIGSQMPNSSALYFQGTSVPSAQGVVFGDGRKCVFGTIVRLGTKTNVGGASQYPSVGNPPISIQGGVVPGQSRYYQIWYRNAAAFCTSATFNLTNGMAAFWTV